MHDILFETFIFQILKSFSMGNFMGKAMEDNLKKNQEFMLEINRFDHPDHDQDGDNCSRITLERQIQMQDQMRERMVAMQVVICAS